MQNRTNISEEKLNELLSALMAQRETLSKVCIEQGGRHSYPPKAPEITLEALKATDGLIKDLVLGNSTNFRVTGFKKQ